jgi:hypothetical protein
MTDIVSLASTCPRAVSELDMIRAALARVTGAYFAGAPVYDEMHRLENELFDMMRPNARRLAGNEFSHCDVINTIYQGE